MSHDYLKHALTPAAQTEQAHALQVPNNAGGFTFQLDDWGRLQRFLILGSEGNTYYSTERKLTRENAQVIERLIKADGPRLVREIVAVSEAGRAPKNDPAILALAMAARLGDQATKEVAYQALPKVCRIGTHLYHFVDFANQLGGWGGGLRRAIARWFNDKPAEDLAYQLVKYQQRDGWSARDVLRLSHTKPKTAAHDALYAWCVDGYDDACSVQKHGSLPAMIGAFEELKHATDEARVCKLIRDYKLPRETVPTQWLTKVAVWEALLPHMGLTAMARNVATMTRVGLLAPMSERTAYVASKLANAEALRKSKVHPIQMLAALKVYAQGRGERGGNTWTPVQAIVDALDAGFYGSFENVQPTGKVTLLALDVSGSMTATAGFANNMIAGMPGMSPRIASAAMALVTLAVEPRAHVVAFTAKGACARRSGHYGINSAISDAPISARMRLDDAIAKIDRMEAGGTDCALPFLWAQDQLARGHGPAVESFAVYTDNETWAGNVHPHVALQQYRQFSGVAARSAVVGMSVTNFTIANPEDPGMLDVVGFDASAPAVMADFFRGTVDSRRA